MGDTDAAVDEPYLRTHLGARTYAQARSARSEAVNPVAKALLGDRTPATGGSPR